MRRSEKEWGDGFCLAGVVRWGACLFVSLQNGSDAGVEIVNGLRHILRALQLPSRVADQHDGEAPEHEVGDPGEIRGFQRLACGRGRRDSRRVLR